MTVALTAYIPASAQKEETNWPGMYFTIKSEIMGWENGEKQGKALVSFEAN